MHSVINEQEKFIYEHLIGLLKGLRAFTDTEVEDYVLQLQQILHVLPKKFQYKDIKAHFKSLFPDIEWSDDLGGTVPISADATLHICNPQAKANQVLAATSSQDAANEQSGTSIANRAYISLINLDAKGKPCFDKTESQGFISVLLLLIHNYGFDIVLKTFTSGEHQDWSNLESLWINKVDPGEGLINIFIKDQAFKNGPKAGYLYCRGTGWLDFMDTFRNAPH